MTSNPSPAPHNPDADRLAVPGSAVLVARLGGTAALLAAAAISASTLYRLGLCVGLVPTTAWLLPAALDIYAACAIFTGYRIPPENPARGAALWNARGALDLPVGCNALEHVLSLAGTVISSAFRDGLLVGVASLPPLIVERLLHLQTLLVQGRAVGPPLEPTSVKEKDVVDGVHERRAPLNVHGDKAVQTESTVDDATGHSVAAAAHREQVRRHRDHSASATTDDAGPSNHRHATGWRHPDQVPVRCLAPTALAEIAAPVYADLAERSGRRPGERVFHQALTDRIAALANDGEIPSEVRMPSLSTAKRVRALIENVQTVEDRPAGR